MNSSILSVNVFNPIFDRKLEKDKRVRELVRRFKSTFYNSNFFSKRQSEFTVLNINFRYSSDLNINIQADLRGDQEEFGYEIINDSVYTSDDWVELTANLLKVFVDWEAEYIKNQEEINKNKIKSKDIASTDKIVEYMKRLTGDDGFDEINGKSYDDYFKSLVEIMKPTLQHIYNEHSKGITVKDYDIGVIEYLKELIQMWDDTRGVYFVTYAAIMLHRWVIKKDKSCGRVSEIKFKGHKIKGRMFANGDRNFFIVEDSVKIGQKIIPYELKYSYDKNGVMVVDDMIEASLADLGKNI